MAEIGANHRLKFNPSKLPMGIVNKIINKQNALVAQPNQQQTLPSRVANAGDKKSLVAQRKRKNKAGPTREQILEFLHEWIDTFSPNESRMLRGIFSLSTTTAREVMIPLSEIIAVHIATPIEQVKAIVRHSNYQHIPVYEERIDRLTGIVSISEVLYAPPKLNELNSLIRPAYYVPETKLTSDLLEELRIAEDPIAIVIDEHAGCVGFITLEDIFEQIVGEIRYNHKRHTPPVELLDNGSWIVDARTSIEVINTSLGANIQSDRCDTIGGFILSLFGRLPEQGEKIHHGGFEFSIEEVFSYGISMIHARQIKSIIPAEQRRDE